MLTCLVLLCWQPFLTFFRFLSPPSVLVQAVQHNIRSPEWDGYQFGILESTYVCKSLRPLALVQISVSVDSLTPFSSIVSEDNVLYLTQQRPPTSVPSIILYGKGVKSACGHKGCSAQSWCSETGVCSHPYCRQHKECRLPWPRSGDHCGHDRCYSLLVCRRIKSQLRSTPCTAGIGLVLATETHQPKEGVQGPPSSQVPTGEGPVQDSDASFLSDNGIPWHALADEYSSLEVKATDTIYISEFCSCSLVTHS